MDFKLYIFFNFLIYYSFSIDSTHSDFIQTRLALISPVVKEGNKLFGNKEKWIAETKEFCRICDIELRKLSSASLVQILEFFNCSPISKNDIGAIIFDKNFESHKREYWRIGIDDYQTVLDFANVCIVTQNILISS
jgi:hypothetical protein